MKEENKEFYYDGCNPDEVDTQIDSFNELVDSIAFDLLNNIYNSEEFNGKVYRNMPSGKNAIAKYFHKSSGAGEDEVPDETYDQEFYDDLYKSLTPEDLALIDSLVDEISSFAESCDEVKEIKDKTDESKKCDDEESQIDPETGEETSDDGEEVNEVFKHMTTMAKMLAKKYRKSASGRRAIKNYMKNVKRRAGRVKSKARSLLMKKVAAFRRGPNKTGSTSESSMALDNLIGHIILNAPRILEELQNEGFDIYEACKKNEDDDSMSLKIEVQFDNEDDFDSMLEKFDDIVLVSKDTDSGTAVVSGEKDDLEDFIEELGYDDDDIDGLVVCDKDDKQEPSVKDQAVERFKDSESGKKALESFERKISKIKESSRYSVAKEASQNAIKVAGYRSEAIRENLDKQFASTPMFEALNEAESNELKSIVFNAVSDILDKSYGKIAEDVTKEYENYMTEEVMPEICNVFEGYTLEIIKNLNEEVERYLSYVSEEIVDSLEGKNLIVKSKRTESLENFTESLLGLIKDKLNIIPEQEDLLVKNESIISELRESIQEANIEKIRTQDKLNEAKKDLYVLKNMPSNISEMQKENLLNYVEDVLCEARTFSEFKEAFDQASKEAVAASNDGKEDEEEETKTKKSCNKDEESNSLAESLFRMGRVNY